ncbi:DNA invertase Pin-like site-specific DNA recombinase [Nitrosomonas oligotropha]|uniref:DNA invertase Pin-like site-specific DNA recombinase n=1 Tax=Nitrosomonas oligotropha TaxID=42354 RepID=A0A2T5I4Y3_9PROT|nr:recombinase family protein [Nitrosomonas oligotropha]PTQ78874.1 DNA invertase Pin-like site-specific DNA recombinase [Nitrosomonas oligotropha]
MRIALYARVSTVKQAEKDLSIPDQLRQMRDWCKANGYTVIMEYVEPGASATDDKRPVFQQLIGDATLKPSPYDAVIVHSLSRFFRDSLAFGLYERRLDKAGVKVISITQQTSDDPSGEMARKIFNIFDEYQSKENSKHTLRAMKENTRQGYFNGSRPTFGYKAVEVETISIKGKKKKRLVIDEQEAAFVRKIYDLYLNGYLGQSYGAKQIAVHLNERGLTLRGAKWARNRVHEVLSNPTYQGEYIFNKRDGKNLKNKPATEWVRMAVDPIIDKSIFEAVQARKAARAPSVVSPRIVNSPTLLTGLLKCGCCGAGMTLATGKGGRYRYYKCNTRASKGNKLCDSRSIPMEKLDSLILNALADNVFDPKRVKIMLSDMKKQIKSAQESQDDGLKKLTKELEEIKLATERLYEAVEKGFLPLDASLQERSHKLNARKQELLIAVAGYRRQQQLPDIKQNQLETFTKALRAKLLDRSSGFGKEYLKLLVSEIRIKNNQAEITGSYSAFAHAVEESKMDALDRVPSFVPNWLTKSDKSGH